MDGTTVTLIVGAVTSFLGLIATIVNILNSNYKESRNRRWAQEDALALAKTQLETKEELAKTTRHTVREAAHNTSLHLDEQRRLLEDLIRTSEGLMQAGEARLKMILDKIEENTRVSKEAFKEANNTNAKLLDLGAQIRDGAPKPVVVVNEQPIPVKETHP